MSVKANEYEQWNSRAEVASVPNAGDEPFGWVLVTPLHDHFETGKLNPYKDGMGAFPLYTRPQPAPAVLSDEQIRSIFLANGFTVKAGQTDLKDYVFKAARAVLAAANPAVPPHQEK